MNDNKTALYPEYLKKQEYDYWEKYRDQFYVINNPYDKLKFNGLLNQILKPEPIKQY